MPEKMIGKEEADYGRGTWHRQCSLCTMWRPPHHCTLVRGNIEEWAVCDYFERKKNAT